MNIYCAGKIYPGLFAACVKLHFYQGKFYLIYEI